MRHAERRELGGAAHPADLDPRDAPRRLLPRRVLAELGELGSRRRAHQQPAPAASAATTSDTPARCSAASRAVSHDLMRAGLAEGLEVEVIARGPEAQDVRVLPQPDLLDVGHAVRSRAARARLPPSSVPRSRQPGRTQSRPRSVEPRRRARSPSQPAIQSAVPAGASVRRASSPAVAHRASGGASDAPCTSSA